MSNERNEGVGQISGTEEFNENFGQISGTDERKDRSRNRILGIIVALTILLVIASSLMIYNLANRDEDETISIRAEGVQLIVTPQSIYADAGEILELHSPDNQGFLIDGSGRSGSYPPFSNEVYVVLISPYGAKYRLTDKISSHKALVSGEYLVTVESRKEKMRIYSGGKVGTKHLSKWDKDEISILVERPEVPNANAMVMKEVRPKFSLAGAIAVQIDKADEAAKTLKKNKEAWWIKTGEGFYNKHFKSFEKKLKKIEGAE